MTLHIKILGGGCANCDRLAQNAKQAVAQLGVEATFEKSGDYAGLRPLWPAGHARPGRQ